MRVVTLLALLFLLSGCATGKIEKLEHQITLEDTAWIQKGITTRSEIEARFGSPNFEVPEYAGSTHETSAMSTPRSDENSPTTKGIVNQAPKDSKATYLHPESSSNVQSPEDRFWVIYDEKNVVKDFGLTGPPTARRSPGPANLPE